MKHKRFSDEQVMGVLKEHEAGAKVDVRELEAENAKLKWIVADQVLDMSAMKELLGKHW